MLSMTMRLLKGRLDLRGLSFETFGTVAVLDGIKGGSRAQLKNAFSQRVTIPEETATKLWNLCRELEEMLDGFLPYALDASDGIRLHSSLQCWRASTALVGMITSDVAEENTPIESAK